MLILFCFIIQAVSYEFRSKKGNLYGKRTYEIFLLINGIGGIILLGVAVGMFFSGGDFVVSRANLTQPSHPFITTWGSAWRGLEAIARPLNLLLGFSLFFLARIQAALYFINSIDNEAIRIRSRHQILINTVPFLLLFLGFLFLLLRSSGYTSDPENEQQLTRSAFHYATSLLEMPAVLFLFIVGVGLLLTGVMMTLLKPSFTKGIWYSGCGTVLAVTALLLLAGWNRSAFFPSLMDPNSSLTLANASSSPLTLQVMSIASLIIPVVLFYIYKVWKTMNKTPLTEAEMQGNDHSY
jgi:cytochrome bd ubiquinol oxidase subunit II